jgi:hypothetical protein
MLVLFILGINAFHFYVIHIGDFLLGVKQQITFFWEVLRSRSVRINHYVV